MAEPTLSNYHSQPLPGGENYGAQPYYYYYRPYASAGANFYAPPTMPAAATGPPHGAPLAMQPANSFSHYGRFAPVNTLQTSHLERSGLPFDGNAQNGSIPHAPKADYSETATDAEALPASDSNGGASENPGIASNATRGFPGPMDREHMLTWSGSNAQIPPYSIWPNAYGPIPPPTINYVHQVPPLPLGPYPRVYGTNGPHPQHLHYPQGPRHFNRHRHSHYGYPGKGDMHGSRYHPSGHIRNVDRRKMDRSAHFNDRNGNNSQGYNSISNCGSRSKLLEELRLQHINSSTFDDKPEKARFFVIKSYSDEDVHKSIKYGVWSSTVGGTKRLSTAFQDCQESDQPLYLFYSVNSSGQFCGVAKLQSNWCEDNLSCWQHAKWQGHFKVKWLFIKDVPNDMLRHIKLNAVDSRSVTTSRDTQEVVFEEGLKILSTFKEHLSSTSLLDDFAFYDKRELGREAARRRKEWRHEQRKSKDTPSTTSVSASSTEDAESTASAEDHPEADTYPNPDGNNSEVNGGPLHGKLTPGPGTDRNNSTTNDHSNDLDFSSEGQCFRRLDDKLAQPEDTVKNNDKGISVEAIGEEESVVTKLADLQLPESLCAEP